MNEKQDMYGRLTLVCTDQTGQEVWRRQMRNHIVTSGRNLVAELFSGTIAGAPPSAVTHMAVGTDASAEADSDTALAAQRGDRKAISSAALSQFVDAGVTRVRVSLQTVFDFNEANDPVVPLREAGIFTAAAGGVLYNRVVFPAVTKTNAFKLTLLWDIVF